MPEINAVIQAIENGKADGKLAALYGTGKGAVEAQKRRYLEAIKAFRSCFPGEENIEIFSTPGRTEIGGNHTDHNAGRVLAAAVDLDALAVVSKSDAPLIEIYSEGYPVIRVNTGELDFRESEKYTSAALVRGVCFRLKELGFCTGGFRAYVASNVLKGSGLSSSAAFEVLVVTILNYLYNRGEIDNITIAKIARFSENRYFGKPCGLMDMTTCAEGGFVTIDFRDFDNPVVKKVGFDFPASGHALVIVDTGGSHAHLNEDYAAVEREMKEVAKALGGRVLRDLSKDAVLKNIRFLRSKVSDRAILRALHFFDDDRRVAEQAEALEKNDLERFKQLVTESGRSSWMLCQNCYSHTDIAEQGIPVALAVSGNLLKGKGAWRVHGGGFAGTIQAFVPDSILEQYLAAMEAIFGDKACHRLTIRTAGTTRVDIL